MNYWLLIFLMALVTFLPRYLPMALANKFKLSPLLERALELVPTAVLVTIITQASLFPDGVLDVSLSNPHFLSAVIASVTALITRQLFLTIIIGLVAFISLRLLMG